MKNYPSFWLTLIYYHHSDFNLRKFLLGFIILQKQWDPNFCYCVSLSCFVLIYNHTVTMVSHKYRELCLIWFPKQYLLGFFVLDKQLANIPDRGFLFLQNTLLLYSLSPYWQTERYTKKQIHSLRVGWKNLFSSCAVVSVFCSGGT